MRKAHAPTLCGHTLGRRRHVCLLYSTPELEFAGLLPFVREGLAAGEHVCHIVAPSERAARLARLAENGIPCDDAVADGRLHVSDWNETYLKDPPFSADAMLDRVRGFLGDAHADGHARVRGWGDMRWIEETDVPGGELLRYERLVDSVASEFPDDVLVCAYDVATLPPRVVSEVAAVHRVVVFDHRMYENPR